MLVRSWMVLSVLPPAPGEMLRGHTCIVCQSLQGLRSVRRVRVCVPVLLRSSTGPSQQFGAPCLLGWRMKMQKSNRAE